MVRRTASSRAFTLIELLVVIAIIGLLSSVVLASLDTARGKARDAKRISDMHELQTALELYYNDHGAYPSSNNNGSGGWEVSGLESDFISALVADGDLPAGVKDPDSSKENSAGNYRYYYYPAGYEGCTQPFYVLGIVATDAQGSAKYSGSPGWKCPSRDWQAEMSWVTGNPG